MMPRRASCAALALAVALALSTVLARTPASSAGELQTPAACTSAGSCLAGACEREWTQYYDLIEKTWASRQRVPLDQLREFGSY